METKIGMVKDFEMLYDPKTRKFIAQNAAGEEVASALTQEKLEEKIDKIAKLKFNFPIKAIRFRSPKYVDVGRVSSLNIDDRSVWYCEDREEGSYAHRGKYSLKYGSGLYELTERNAEILAELRILLSGITELEEKVQLRAKGLEKPIDLEYFGLASRY